ncbi:CHAT domain-containing protein [Alteromonadaceae bacterium BrNp21-10]|nr:CHAT domain-containing protein [Alteromonadaceae bacterium BrNp21-10]
MTSFKYSLLIVITFLGFAGIQNSNAATIESPSSSAHSLFINLDQYQRISPHLQVQSTQYTFKLKLWRGTQFLQEFTSTATLLQTEYLSLADSSHDYRLEVLADSTTPLLPRDIHIIPVVLDEADTTSWQLLTGISSSWTQERRQQSLLSSLQTHLQELPTSNHWYCPVLYKSMAMQLTLGQFQALLAQSNNIQIQTQSDDRLCPFHELFAANANFQLYRFDQAQSQYAKQLSQWPPSMRPTKPFVQLMLGFSQILNGAMHSDKNAMAEGKANLDPISAEVFEQHPQWSPTLYNALATYYSLSNDLPLAAQMLENAIRTQQQLRNADNISDYLNNLALIYLWTGKLNSAQKTFQQSIQLARNHNDAITLATQTTNLAKSYRYIGDLPAAERYYLQALDIIAQQQVDEGTTIIYLELAQIALSEQRYQQAIEWLMASERDAIHRRSDKLPVVYANLSLAHAFNNNRIQSQLFKQKVLANQGSNIKDEDGFDMYFALAKAQFELNDLAASLSLLSQAEAFLIADTPAFIDYHTLLMQVALKQQRSQPSTSKSTQIDQHFEQAFAQIKRIESTLDFEKLGPQWMNQARTLVEHYLHYLLSSQQRNKWQQALDVMESYQFTLLAKSRDYYLNLQQQPLDENLQFNHAWKRKLQAEVQLLKADVSERSMALQQLDRANEQFLLHKSKLSIATQTNPTLDLTAIQQQLQPQQVILRYVLLAGTQWVFTITQQHWQLNAISTQGIDIQALAKQIPSIAAGTFIPKSVLDDSSKKELIIIADGQLHQLAFSALNMASSEQPYQPLIQRFSILHSYSLSHFFNQESVHSQGTDIDFAIFANPNFSTSDVSTTPNNDDWLTSLPQLDWSAKEADYIQTIFADSRFHLAVEENATKKQLLSAPMRNASVLHIATHGYYSVDNPDVVGIATAADHSHSAAQSGFLSLTELLSQPIQSQLVFISGCDTVQGELWASEGLNGLARGMLALGAGSVIGTLWQVPDRATSEFVKHFYQALKLNQGHTAKALQYAQQRMLASARYRHPKYWAGFVLTAAHRQFSNIKLNFEKLTKSVR